MRRFSMTPQPRKSLKAPLSSMRPTVLSSRPSLNAEDIKPSRNVRDRQYKQDCIENVVDFLTANNHEGTATAKSLQNPSNKEFQTTFRFIFSFIDPTPLVRFEDEALVAIKMLRYPYCNEITRSQLAAVTPHTWPVILSMLSWLVDLVRQTEAKEETASVEKAFFEYVCEGYERFMLSHGDDNDEEHDQEFVERMERLHARDAELIDELRNELEKKERKVTEYKDKLCDTPGLENRKKKIVEDLNMLIAHERQLEVKKKKYIDSIEKIADEIRSYETSIDTLIQLKNDLLEQINQQTVNPEDIKGMNIEKVNLYKELERMKPEREAAVKNIMALESTIAEKTEENERIIGELLQSRAGRIVENELARIKSLNAALGSSSQEMTTVHEEESTKEQGGALIQKIEDAIVDRREMLVNHEIHVATLEESIIEKSIVLKDLEEQYEHLNMKLKTIGAIYLEKKEIADRNRQRSRSDIDKLDNDLLLLKLESDSAFLKSEKECSEAKIKLEILLSNIRRENQEISKAIWQLTNTADQQLKILAQLKKDIRNTRRSI